MKKNFKHDCDQCVFLGDFVQNEIIYDLYWCSSVVSDSTPSLIVRYASLIARYGNARPEYVSTLPPECLVGHSPSKIELEILSRGMLAGLYQPWHTIREYEDRTYLAETEVKVLEAVLKGREKS